MRLILILFLLVAAFPGKPAPANPQGDSFTWGNTTYLNLRAGEAVTYEGVEIELLRMHNHYNLLRVGEDTTWLKVSYRSPAMVLGNLTLFVADNRLVASASADPQVHGLLTKDVLLAVSPAGLPLIDKWEFSFPVSFTGGYIWRNDEDSYMFSYQGAGNAKPGKYLFFPGVALDMLNARASEKHAILAMEAGKVVWVDTRVRDSEQPKATVCIESASSPGIYYIYQNLYSRNLLVSKNQSVVRGDPVGFIWGDGNRENLTLGIVRRDSVPTPASLTRNTLNFFPQLMELYYGRQPVSGQMFTKGQISFGKPAGTQGNIKNVSAFEEYQGTGWILGNWNIADKVEWVSGKQLGNARLSKVLFHGQPAECTNPHPWYDYRINVKNGVYRIRALVGDCFQPTWQKVEFNGVSAGTFKTTAGEFTWTPEKIIRVKEGQLNVRLVLGEPSQLSGISEIVFQLAQL